MIGISCFVLLHEDLDPLSVDFVELAHQIGDGWDLPVLFEVVEELVFDSDACPDSPPESLRHERHEGQDFQILHRILGIGLVRPPDDAKEPKETKEQVEYHCEIIEVLRVLYLITKSICSFL